MTIYHDPPNWNPPSTHQLCNCEHEQNRHGGGQYWTSCQADDCECTQFHAATQSPEAKIKFREEMDAGLRCRRCGSSFHLDEYHDRPVYGGPVCHYPECGYEPDAAEIASAVMDELAERYSDKLKKNPEWDRKAEKAAWDSGAEYPVPEYIARSPEELRRESCYVVFKASDGGNSIRALTYAEVGEVVRDVIARELKT